MKGTSFSSDCYVTSATVFRPALALRCSGGDRRSAEVDRNGFALACGISVCVCLPMAGEVAALMVLFSGPVGGSRG